jgi:hypothetical protein
MLTAEMLRQILIDEDRTDNGEKYCTVITYTMTVNFDVHFHCSLYLGLL